MSFDKNYPNRKDQRKPYYDSRKHSRSCRNHGSCPYCERSRRFQTNRLKSAQLADSKME